MAKSLNYIASIFLTLSFFVLAIAEAQHFARQLSPAALGLKREKLSHLHFYLHDIVSGKNPTAVRIAQAATTNTSSTGFGLMVMIDDPLTLRPELNSKLVGRAQGIYAAASLTDLGLLMNVNFFFVEGKYNGSTLSLLGRNNVLSTVREMPIVGGSGLFRFARGYALSRTHSANARTGDAVAEFNVYVYHY